MSQLSLFSAAARDPVLRDIDGLLAGPGQVVRRNDTARVSVVVTAEWRVVALRAALARLGVDAEVEAAEAEDSGPAATAVRTPWLVELRPIADAWTQGAIKLPPPGWELDGPRLRWWCLAAGTGGGGMYTLALGASDEAAWPAVGAALAAAGVPGLLVGPRADGPAYRIVGQRRLLRLRELVGEPPPGAPADGWPASGYARGA
jgi:hypothetical protein